MELQYVGNSKVFEKYHLLYICGCLVVSSQCQYIRNPYGLFDLHSKEDKEPTWFQLIFNNVFYWNQNSSNIYSYITCIPTNNDITAVKNSEKS